MIGLDLLEALQIEPVKDEVARERLGARILQHALDLLRAARVSLPSSPRIGELEQLVVGNRVPEEERQLRRERDVVDGVGFAGRHAFGRHLDAIEEIRAREDAGDAAANAFLEAVRGRRRRDSTRADSASRTSASGRRYARVASSLKMRSAQTCSSSPRDGWQTKILSRLGVALRPVGCTGR